MPLIFDYGLDSPQFGSLLLSLVAAFLSGFLVAQPPSARRTGARVLAVALLAVLSTIQGGPLLLTATLLVFAAGDAFLAQDDERATRPWLACMLAGQVGYAVLFFRGVDAGLYTGEPWRLVLCAVVLAAVLAMLRRAVPKTRDFRRPLFLALALSGVSAILAFGTVVPGLMAGGILLIVLAALMVRAHGSPQAPPRWLPLLGWVDYYAAHLVITLAALALI